jgi:ABC-2 type transport system permease protein
MTAIALAPAARLSATGIVRSEWIKLRSVRSTVWSYAVIVVVGFGMAGLASLTNDYDNAAIPPSSQNSILLQASTLGIYFAQLVVGVLGVLAISGEYATGMIRSTLTAVPRRIPALAAKALVLFVATFIVGLITSFGSLGISAALFNARGPQPDFADGSLVGNLLLSAVYLGLTAVFALGLGTVLRSSAGGIAAALGAILLLPTIFQLIAGIAQAQWAADVIPYLIANAGISMYTPNTTGAGLDQMQNLVVVLVWVAVSLVGGALLLKRRDA